MAMRESDAVNIYHAVALVELTVGLYLNGLAMYRTLFFRATFRKSFRALKEKPILMSWLLLLLPGTLTIFVYFWDHLIRATSTEELELGVLCKLISFVATAAILSVNISAITLARAVLLVVRGNTKGRMVKDPTKVESLWATVVFGNLFGWIAGFVYAAVYWPHFGLYRKMYCCIKEETFGQSYHFMLCFAVFGIALVLQVVWYSRAYLLVADHEKTSTAALIRKPTFPFRLNKKAERKLAQQQEVMGTFSDSGTVQNKKGITTVSSSEKKYCCDLPSNLSKSVGCNPTLDLPPLKLRRSLGHHLSTSLHHYSSMELKNSRNGDSLVAGLASEFEECQLDGEFFHHQGEQKAPMAGHPLDRCHSSKGRSRRASYRPHVVAPLSCPNSVSARTNTKFFRNPASSEGDAEPLGRTLGSVLTSRAQSLLESGGSWRGLRRPASAEGPYCRRRRRRPGRRRAKREQSSGPGEGAAAAPRRASRQFLGKSLQVVAWYYVCWFPICVSAMMVRFGYMPPLWVDMIAAFCAKSNAIVHSILALNALKANQERSGDRGRRRRGPSPPWRCRPARSGASFSAGGPPTHRWQRYFSSERWSDHSSLGEALTGSSGGDPAGARGGLTAVPGGLGGGGGGGLYGSRGDGRTPTARGRPSPLRLTRTWEPPAAAPPAPLEARWGAGGRGRRGQQQPGRRRAAAAGPSTPPRGGAGTGVVVTVGGGGTRGSAATAAAAADPSNANGDGQDDDDHHRHSLFVESSPPDLAGGSSAE